MEPISPELVLIDPQLGRAERARLDERSRLASIVDISTPRRVAELAVPASDPRSRSSRLREAAERAATRERLLPALLSISLLFSGILVAVAITHTRGEKQSAAMSAAARKTGARHPVHAVASAPFVMGTVHTRSRPVATSRAAQRTRTAARASATETQPGLASATKAIVERKVLALVVESPRGKLPPSLIDPRTGLAKNNLQAACRRQDTSRSFLCVVRPLQHKPGEGLYVRYRPGRAGRGVFTWSRYREP